MERFIPKDAIAQYTIYLKEAERSKHTIEKYLRDIKSFCIFAKTQPISKALVLSYKEQLAKTHAVTGANSMLAALNSFFRFLKWDDCCIRLYKVQRRAYCSEERELSRAEYMRLLSAAKASRNERLCLLLETIGATGMRVSELQFITVEAVRKGEVRVHCKGKSRTVFLVKKLQKQLLAYAKENHIVSGVIFITKNKKPLDRTTIWRQMKSLCKRAHVSEKKVFPHNLRHLFARAFYAIKKDLAKLADVLGHTNINTTRIYVATTGSEHRRLLEQMRLVL